MTDYEGCLRAAKALEDAYRAVFAVARAGVTADQIDAVLRERLAACGAELKPSGISPFVVAEGGAPPKLRINRVPLERGRMWAMDNSISCNGYWADIGRYAYFGDVPADLHRAHSRVLDFQDAIAAEVKPGRKMGDIFRALPREMPFEVHRIATDASMDPFCGNTTKGVAEGMARGDAAGLTFEVGQVVCVEIWAGLSGGIEDMYLMESSGVRRITTLPREIQVIRE
jgi:Xaa-Pro aminopeptidase